MCRTSELVSSVLISCQRFLLTCLRCRRGSRVSLGVEFAPVRSSLWRNLEEASSLLLTFIYTHTYTAFRVIGSHAPGWPARTRSRPDHQHRGIMIHTHTSVFFPHTQLFTRSSSNNIRSHTHRIFDAQCTLLHGQETTTLSRATC